MPSCRNNKRVIVLCATGSVGAYATLDIVAAGYDVIAVGHRVSDNGFFAQYGVLYISLNVCNIEEFEKLPHQGVFAIVNLAGALPARMEGYHPQRYIDTIMTGMLNTLMYAQQVGVDRIIYAQSISDVSYLFGQSDIPISADAERRFPVDNDHSVYSICKNAAVDLLEHYYNKYGIKRFVLRFPNITLYHPCPFDHIDGKRRWVSYRWMIQQATEGKPLEIWGNPKCKRDIVYVKDCTQIILGALSASCDGGIYNVGTGVGVTMEDQVRGIAEVFAPKVEKIEIRYRADKPDSPEFILDVSKTERELGYRSRYDYLTALRDFKKERELNRFYLLWGKEVDE